MRTSRRNFLRNLACGTVAAPYFIPSSAIGADGTVAPSNRITLGIIGCGGKGTNGMQNFMGVRDTQILALADPNTQHRQRAAGLAKVPPENQHRDFRELLDRKDVDAVLVGTPDHWHTLISNAAAKAGKDVYCEKPLANVISEGQYLRETIHRYGTVFQHGTQLKSSFGTRHACELVRNGRLGEIKEIKIGSPPGIATGFHQPQPVPPDFDYDLWLGPAPWAPYCPARVGTAGGLPGWYFVSDYSKSGWVAGYGVHDIDIAQWAIGMERSGPVEIEGTGVYPAEGLFDTVLTYELHFKYANGFSITMTDTGRNRHGVTFVGTKGTVFTRGGIECDPPSLMREKFSPGEVHLYESANHEANFIQCVKSRAETLTPIDIAHRSCSTCLLGGIALKLGRKLRWNPDTEHFIDDPQAESLLTYPMRAPWKMW
ncbi:MAG TPA: Gfo/Idh/MocA family oxidoreductase [Planctomycetota bacterium]|jgi:predicted dehydrogenase